ncbi:MAG: N-succinylarginine dihydrolase [Pseudomonadota bacterium]
MSKAWEVNFDGLIGPSHNYGGLSDGNLASANNAGDVSRPRDAALQGLEKMRLLVRAGLKQGVLPPMARPDFWFLNMAGFSGAEHGNMVVYKVAEKEPHLLKIAYSASDMWAANAGTVSPSADTEDGRVHISPANLFTMLHRNMESSSASIRLHYSMFGPDFFEELDWRDHPKFAPGRQLISHPDFSDEGAANHVRLCSDHGAQGVEIFVYGREAGESTTGFPARQTRLASECIARSHGLRPERTVFARQARKAIDAGAFHNDVVCVGTLDTLFFHEFAFENIEATLEDIRRAADGLFELKPLMVPDEEVPLADAISSYLFNSQLLQWPGEDRLVLLAPTETRDTPSTARYCERLVEGNGPIGRVQYVDVRQSMRNGGGPACLRLRVVMTEEEIAAAHQGVFLNEEKIDALQSVVRETYREELAPRDLADPVFAIECRKARDGLLKVLDLEALS